ncbi:MAG: antitoxin family protein [Candidatus Competibacteraceae bacterium]
MTQTIEAIFDGKVIRPDQPLALAVNTRVRVTIESIAETPCPRHSFLNTAREIKIKGPPIGQPVWMIIYMGMLNND